MSRQPEELEIGFWGRVLRRHHRLVLAVTLLCAVVTVAVLWYRGPGYRATAEVFVPGADVASEVQFVRSRHVLDTLVATLGYLPNVAVDAGEGDAVVGIEATARAPQDAARAADTYAATYVRLRQEAADQAFRAAVADLERAVADKQAELAAVPRADPGGRAAVLQRELTAYQDALAAAVSGGVADARERPVVLQQATVAPLRNGPAVVLYGLAAALVGLVAGLGIAAIRVGLDPRAGGPGEVAQALRVPMLGVVPAVAGRRDRCGPLTARLLARPGTPRGEAVDLVRARLLTKDRRKLRGTVQVCAAAEVDRTDAAAVAINLAQSIARSGVSCTLVWADFRYPADVLSVLGVDADAVGVAEVADRGGLAETLLHPEATDGLSVLVPGASPVSVADLLSGRGFARLLTEVVDVAEVAVVHTPPLSEHADGQLVGGVVDAVVLVASARTRRADLDRAEEDLRSTGANIEGTVFVGPVRA